MTNIYYFFQAAALSVVMIILKIMPLDMASALGGWLGRTIGPHLVASRKAIRHIELAMPELNDAQKQEIIIGMWDNIGRILAEYPHLKEIGRTRITIDIDDAVKKLMDADRPCIMLGGHFANWELSAAAMLSHFNRPLDLTYRALNNPWVDKMLMNARTLNGQVRYYAKSRKGGYGIIRTMREGRNIAMMIDQKYNEGIAVPFFGHPAMTNPAFVHFGRKFDYPLVPVHIERLNGPHFKITLHKPLETDDKDTEDIILQANRLLEDWVRKRPEQWLWLHRRWGSEKLRNVKEES